MATRVVEKIQNGFTQKELADRLGVQQPHLSAWFNGRHLPRFETVIRLAEILNYDPDELDDYFQNVYSLRKTKNTQDMVILDITEQLKLIDIPNNSKVVVQIYSNNKVQELSSIVSE